ncbi:hypothetical protein Tco_0699831 [Tanacetum coccineum]
MKLGFHELGLDQKGLLGTSLDQVLAAIDDLEETVKVCVRMRGVPPFYTRKSPWRPRSLSTQVLDMWSSKEVTWTSYGVVAMRGSDKEVMEDGDRVLGICSSLVMPTLVLCVWRTVTFLKKPNESVGFTEIVDFLKGSSLRYALTHNPTIYDSLVKQFWQTATVRTLANAIQELVAFIDNKEYTITKAYVRSKLQLADATSITNFLDADIYVGLATLGCSTRSRSLDRQDTKIPQSQGPTITLVPDEVTTTRVGVNTEGATTTTTGLDAGLDSGNINESPLRSYDIPLHDVNMSRSLEDSLKVKELSLLVPKLELKIGSLEKELKDTRKTFGNAILTLVDRVKSLEVALKRKSKKVILDFVTPTKTRVSASVEAQEEDISPTTLEAAKTLSKVASQKARLTDKGRRYKRRKMSKGKDISAGLDAKVEVNTGNEEVNIGIEEVNTSSTKFNTGSIPVSTPSIVQKVKVIVPSPDKGQREGKAQMIDKDVHLDEMVAKRVQVEEELTNQQAQRMPQVHEKLAQLKKLTFEELKTEFEKLGKSIKSFVPMGSEERVKRQGIQLEQETSKKQQIYVKDVPEEKGDEPKKKRGKRKKQIARKGKHIDKTAQDETEEEKEAFMKDKVTGASSESKIGIDDIPTATKPPSIVDWKIIPQSVIKKYGANRPEEMYDRVLCGDLKTMFDPHLIYYLTLDASTIYMLADRKYPLSKDACQAMLNMKLLDGSKDEVCYQLLKMMEKQAGIR